MTRSEVIVIGAAHSGLLRLREFSPAHIRAALARSAPTMVGVESNPVWFASDLFFSVTYECQGVAIPWAVEKNLPVYGVDWQDYDEILRDAERRRRALGEGTEASVTKEALRKAGRTDCVRRKAAPTTFDAWNTPGAPLPASPTETEDVAALLEHRDTRICEQCLVLLRRYPGSRLAVVIGARHKPPLDGMLAEYDDVSVLQLTDLGGLSEEEIEASWFVRDALACLMAELDSDGPYFYPEGVNTTWAHELLEFASGRTDGAEITYLAARLLGVSGDVEASQAMLQRIPQDADGPTRHLVAGQWLQPLTIGQRARVEQGRLSEMASCAGEAREHYEAVLQMLDDKEPAPVSAGPHETCVDRIAACMDYLPRARHARCKAVLECLIRDQEQRAC